MLGELDVTRDSVTRQRIGQCKQWKTDLIEWFSVSFEELTHLNISSTLGLVASVLGDLVTVPGNCVPSALGRIASTLGDSSPRKETRLLQRA
ncbi:hypothetical protein Sjap_011604 [Stephania japonica]|uniref:Uncharacterized protein n=1 Tax=Stephania japonica TaxID=461633 RepID=A0AAP0JDT8_9MAGN